MTAFSFWAKAKALAWWRATKWTVLATLRSIANLSIERYPEIERSGKLADLTGDNLVPELVAATKAYEQIQAGQADAVSLDDAIDLAKASLEESKKQTEYQDNKASRLLTVTSFVSALSGALLATFSDRYPLDTLNIRLHCGHLVLVAAYIAFLSFSLFALCGALVTFHATRTRFKYTTDEAVGDEARAPKSMLFYKGIIGTGPKGWAESFVSTSAGGGATVRDNLKTVYLRHYVIEAYLVAAKTADKLRYLGPAQALLAWAMRLLILFVILFAAAVIFVPRTKPAPPPTQVQVQPVSTPVPVRIVPPPPAPMAPGAAAAAGSGK